MYFLSSIQLLDRNFEKRILALQMEISHCHLAALSINKMNGYKKTTLIMSSNNLNFGYFCLSKYNKKF